MLTSTEIIQSYNRVKKVVKKTPLQFSERLSEKYSAKIYIKREDLQIVRSYKIRGAYNLMSQLTPDQTKNGIVCASAGNHAQGVALGCKLLEIKGTIFMPTTTPNQKISKVKKFGGDFVEIQIIGNTFDEASAAATEFCEQNNATFVHPFNDERIIAGQGTIAKEILDELGQLDYFVCAIGGGGVSSGCSTYFKEISPDSKVIGVEPSGAPSAYESLKKGEVVKLEKIDTFVDGAAVAKIGDITFNIIKNNLEKIVLVDEGQVCTTMIDLYQEDGLVSEPAGALSISALDEIKDEIKGKTVVCLVSGGNNDLLRYPEIVERSLVYKGLKHYFIIGFKQKPGQLKSLLNDVLPDGVDITRFEYLKKNNREKAPAFIGLELADKSQLQILIQRLNEHDFDFEKIETDNILYGYLV